MSILVRRLSACLLLAAFTSCSLLQSSQSVQLQNFASVKTSQRQEVWCWAACAEMILSYDGTPTAQEEIAARIHGHGEDGSPKVAAATRYEIYKALSPGTEVVGFDAIWQGLADQLDEELSRLGERLADDDLPGDVSVDVDESVGIEHVLDSYLPKKSVPLTDLKAGNPAVVGLREAPDATEGHLVVLVGAEFTEWIVAPKQLEWVTDFFADLFAAKRDLDDDMETLDETSARLGFSDKEVLWVEVIDPWEIDDPLTEHDEMRIRIPFDDFLARVDFVTTREGAHEVLTRWSRAATGVID